MYDLYIVARGHDAVVDLEVESGGLHNHCHFFLSIVFDLLKQMTDVGDIGPYTFDENDLSLSSNMQAWVSFLCMSNPIYFMVLPPWALFANTHMCGEPLFNTPSGYRVNNDCLGSECIEQAIEMWSSTGTNVTVIPQ